MKRILLALVLLLFSSGIANAQLAVGNITTGGTDCTTATNCVILPMNPNTNTVRITITGTWTGTLQFNWAGANAPLTETNGFGVVNINPASFAQASTTTANGSFVGVNNNFTHIMVRGSTLSSGTAVVRIQASSNASSTSLIFGSGAGGTIGTVNQGTASLTENWRVNCVSGCSGGTTDTDDGSIASGQATGLSLGLQQVFDGTVWRRFTIGVAGTASAQVLTVQGIASMTPLLASQSGTWNIGTVTTVSAVTAISNALPAGANVIGHVINDSGSTTAVTGNVTVVQGTGTSLHAVLDTTSTTAVTQATGTNLHAVIDSGSTTAVTGNVTVVGAAASGAAKSGNPVQMGGVFNTTQPTVTTGQAVELQTTARGAQIIATGVDIPHMICDSGCTSSSLPSDNSAFTAGTTGSSPISGFYHSTRDTLTDGRIGAFALTSKRAVYSSIETPNGDSALDESLDSVKVTNSTANTATSYLTMRLSDGSTFPTLSTDATTGTTAQTTGPQDFCKGSAATPTAVSDGQSVAFWCTVNGALNISATNLSTNIAQINAVTPLMGNGVTGTGSLRVTLASDPTSNTNPYYTSSVGTSTTAAASGCYLVSAASTNSTSCKGSAGNLFGIRMINTTTTVYYLRLYNSAGAPTCSSATGFIESIPIPPASAAGQAGGVVEMSEIPINYGTGIGFCFTGGSGSTDNTNAAVGVFGKLVYK